MIQAKFKAPFKVVNITVHQSSQLQVMIRLDDHGNFWSEFKPFYFGRTVILETRFDFIVGIWYATMETWISSEVILLLDNWGIEIISLDMENPEMSLSDETF